MRRVWPQTELRKELCWQREEWEQRQEGKKRLGGSEEQERGCRAWRGWRRMERLQEPDTERMEEPDTESRRVLKPQ